MAHAQDTEFNTDFLQDVTDQISIDAVKHGYSIVPGRYDFVIIINNEKVGNRNLEFYKNAQNNIVPCFDQAFVDDYQLLFLSPEQKQQDSNGCYDLTAIPDAAVSTDFGLQRLNLAIPQIHMTRNIRGYISPQLFDQGISALILNYSANTNYFRNKNGDNRHNHSLFLNGGANIGAWRYRNQSNFSEYSGQASKWENVSNKLERDLQTAIPSRIEIGDSFSNSDIFESTNFRGVQLSSDTVQLPISLQNYAPVIRGNAQTNALVEVKQNGYIIYSTNVAAGNFVIEDLYAANESGDLEVRVIESDGRVRSFIQPYSSVQNMVRPKQSKYQFTAGQYRSGNDNGYHPYFGQLTYAYGLNNYLTPYTGIIAGEEYYSAAAGIGWSIGRFGALSSDITYAYNETSQGDRKEGVSLRFLYAKSLNNLGTNFRLVGYRYSTQDYYSFNDAIQERAIWRDGNYQYRYDENRLVNDDQLSEQERYRYFYSSTYYNKRNQFQVSINQNLGQWGQLYGSLSKTDFWQKEYNQESWQVGYNQTLRGISYGFYYQKNKSMFQGSESNIGFNISIPLDRPMIIKKYDVISNSTYQYSDYSGSSANTTLFGSFLEDKNLNAQLQVGYTEQNHANSLGINSNYRGSKLNSSLGYNYSTDYQQVSASINGGMLVHSGGVLFGQQMYSNPILIEAKGAQGVRVENQPGLKIDKNGYAIVSGSSAYGRNRVALRSEDLGQNINIDNPIVNDIVPTKFAVVKVKFDVKTGQSVLANLHYKNRAVNTGAAIIDPMTQQNLGVVGLLGQAFLTGVNSKQALIAKWGDDISQQCHFTLPALRLLEIGYDEVNINCLEQGVPTP